MNKKQAKPRKWNRAHFFKRKKSTKRQVGHPVYVYGKSGRYYKYLTFTHTPERGKEKDYEKLRHNIDPKEDAKATYVKRIPDVTDQKEFRTPDKKYRIHEDDVPTIRKYKK